MAQVPQNPVDEALGAIGQQNQEQQNRDPPANDGNPAQLLEVNILFLPSYIVSPYNCFLSLKARHVVTLSPHGLCIERRVGLNLKLHEISQPFASFWLCW